MTPEVKDLKRHAEEIVRIIVETANQKNLGVGNYTDILMRTPRGYAMPYMEQNFYGETVRYVEKVFEENPNLLGFFSKLERTKDGDKVLINFGVDWFVDSFSPHNDDILGDIVFDFTGPNSSLQFVWENGLEEKPKVSVGLLGVDDSNKTRSYHAELARAKVLSDNGLEKLPGVIEDRFGEFHSLLYLHPEKFFLTSMLKLVIERLDIPFQEYGSASFFELPEF